MKTLVQSCCFILCFNLGFFISFLIQDAMWNRKAAIKLKKLNRCCPSGDISVSALRAQLCVSPIHY